MKGKTMVEMIIKAAFATDDGKTSIDRHFGDANFFDIYEITIDSFNFIKRVTNSSEDREHISMKNKG